MCEASAQYDGSSVGNRPIFATPRTVLLEASFAYSPAITRASGNATSGGEYCLASKSATRPKIVRSNRRDVITGRFGRESDQDRSIVCTSHSRRRSEQHRPGWRPVCASKYFCTAINITDFGEITIDHGRRASPLRCISLVAVVRIRRGPWHLHSGSSELNKQRLRVPSCWLLVTTCVAGQLIQVAGFGAFCMASSNAFRCSAAAAFVIIHHKIDLRQTGPALGTVADWGSFSVDQSVSDQIGDLIGLLRPVDQRKSQTFRFRLHEALYCPETAGCRRGAMRETRVA